MGNVLGKDRYLAPLPPRRYKIPVLKYTLDADQQWRLDKDQCGPNHVDKWSVKNNSCKQNCLEMP